MNDIDARLETGDEPRLWCIRECIRLIMLDGRPRTLKELQRGVGRGSEQTISAKLRDLRKLAYGGHAIARRQRTGEAKGVNEYWMVVDAREGEQMELEGAA